MSSITTLLQHGDTGASRGPRELVSELRGLPRRIRDLELAVQENRQLNRRVAELTDIVAELLVPIVDRDEEKVRELLAEYRRTTLAP